MKSPLLTLPPRQLWSFIFMNLFLMYFLQRSRTVFTHLGHLQKLDVKIAKLIFFFFTEGTSLSTTVFRISIHSVRFSLLMSSRGRLYCRDSLVTKKKKKTVVQRDVPPTPTRELDFNGVTTTNRPSATMSASYVHPLPGIGRTEF